MTDLFDNIAIYLRISKEEEEGEESDSIENQRELLCYFIKESEEFVNSHILEFTDDGYSGTNLDRPAMQRLLSQVKERKINCILVKDFSRFSRDYIELGTYLEQIFPFLGVRFISLNDDYDSAKEKGIEMGLQTAFQNLLYDWYSKDLSIKVKNSLKAQKENGLYNSAHLPYGYRKDSSDKHQVRIDEKEAEIVRRIFLLAIQGRTSYEIAKYLNQIGIKTQTGTALWRAGTIYQILKNPFYIGTMVYGKYETTIVGEKSRLKAREKWKQISNHHEMRIANLIQILYMIYPRKCRNKGFWHIQCYQKPCFILERR